MSTDIDTRTARTTATAQAAPASPDRAVPPGEAAEGAARRRIALALLVSAQFVVMLDTSIVNVALPSIQADLSLDATGLTWVVNAYVLAFGGLLLLSGRAADLFGRRRLFVTGSAIFTAGTLVAAFATTEAQLLPDACCRAWGLRPSARQPCPCCC